MLIILILAGGLWTTAEGLGIIKEGQGIAYVSVIIVQIILITLAFILSMVFFGSIVEYHGREPGVITLAFAYTPPLLYMYALGLTQRFLYLFVVLSILVILYYLYSE